MEETSFMLLKQIEKIIYVAVTTEEDVIYRLPPGCHNYIKGNCLSILT